MYQNDATKQLALIQAVMNECCKDDRFASRIVSAVWEAQRQELEDTKERLCKMQSVALLSYHAAASKRTKEDI